VCLCLWVGVLDNVRRSIRVSQEQIFCHIFMELSTAVLTTNLSSFVQIGAGKGRTFHVGVIGIAVTALAVGPRDIFGSKERLCTTSRSAPFAVFVQVAAI